MQTTQQDRRDQFAMAAMQALIGYKDHHGQEWYDDKTLAESAYHKADAMIAASATPAPSGKLIEAAMEVIDSYREGCLRRSDINDLEACIKEVCPPSLATANEPSEMKELPEIEGVPREWAIKVTAENYDRINQLPGDLCASHHIGMFAYCFSDNYMQFSDKAPAECAVITDAHLSRIVFKQQ